MNEQYNLVGFINPHNDYPHRVVPVVTCDYSEGKEKHAYYPKSFTTTKRIDDDCCIIPLPDALLDKLKHFDCRRHGLFAINCKDLLVFNLEEEEIFFRSLLHDSRFKKWDPLVRYYIALNSDDILAIRSQIHDAHAHLTSISSLFANQWRERAIEELNASGSKQKHFSLFDLSNSLGIYSFNDSLSFRVHIELNSVYELLVGDPRRLCDALDALYQSISRMRNLIKNDIPFDDPEFLEEDLNGFHGAVLGVGSQRHTIVKNIVSQLLHESMASTRRQTEEFSSKNFLDEHVRIAEAIAQRDRPGILLAYERHIWSYRKSPDPFLPESTLHKRAVYSVIHDVFGCLTPGDSYFVLFEEGAIPIEFEYPLISNFAIAYCLLNQVQFYYLKTKGFTRESELIVSQKYSSLKDAISTFMKKSNLHFYLSDLEQDDTPFRILCDKVSGKFPLGILLRQGKVVHVSHWDGNSRLAVDITGFEEIGEVLSGVLVRESKIVVAMKGFN